MKFLKITLFSILTFFCNEVKTQTLQIDNIQANLGDTACVSINISNIDSLSAITLSISYDTTKVNFINYNNLNPHISGIMINDIHNITTNARLGKIAVSWADLNSVNFNTEILVKFNFKILAGGYCPLIFLPNCELANYMGQIISTNYINGGITITESSIKDNERINFKFYPNPSNGIISIENRFINEKSELQLYNMQGEILYSEIFYNTNLLFVKEINLNTYPKGIYFLKIKNNKFARIEKLVLQ